MLADPTAALEANLWSLWRNFGRGPGCSLVDEPGLLRFETPIAQAPYNAVMRFAPDEDLAADGRIEAILAHYDERGVPLLWVVHPTARPHDLEDRLSDRGLSLDASVLGMVGELAALPEPGPPPPEVEIVEARASEDDDVVELIAWRYQLPPEAAAILRETYRVLGVGAPGASTRIWVAMMDGRPVSKAVLHVGGGVAGLHGVATRPEARGLGLARWLTLKAFDAARRSGIAWGVLHSTPMAESLYERLGFRGVAPFRLYATPGSLEL